MLQAPLIYVMGLCHAEINSAGDAVPISISYEHDFVSFFKWMLTDNTGQVHIKSLSGIPLFVKLIIVPSYTAYLTARNALGLWAHYHSYLNSRQFPSSQGLPLSQITIALD